MELIKNEVDCLNCAHCEEQSVEESCYHSSDGLKTLWTGMACGKHDGKDVRPITECCASDCDHYEEEALCEYEKVMRLAYCFSDLYKMLDKTASGWFYHICYTVGRYYYQKGYAAAMKDKEDKKDE